MLHGGVASATLVIADINEYSADGAELGTCPLAKSPLDVRKGWAVKNMDGHNGAVRHYALLSQEVPELLDSARW
jgi:hypothetical protein